MDEKKHTILIEKVIDSLNDYLSYILKYLEVIFKIRNKNSRLVYNTFTI